VKQLLLALLALVVLACDRGHSHEPAEPREPEAVRITRFSERFELFAEHPPAIAGQSLTLLAHVTVLDRFRALDAGTARLELAGPSELSSNRVGPTRKGIFELLLTPPAPGKYRARVVIEGPLPGTIGGFEIEVFADAQAARKAPHDDEAVAIQFLKEQQWSVPFELHQVQVGSLIASVEGSGSIDTPPGGSAEIGAPVAGRLVALAKGLPHPGTEVRKGQPLAALAPAPSSPEDAARAKLAVAESEARASAAKAQLERAERLIKDEAISQKELEDARREAAVAAKSVSAARQASAIFSGARAGAGAGSWQLTSPIAGTLVEVKAKPGSSVSPGDLLFRIVDTRELWVRARVPEQDAFRLRADRDASFQPAGLDSWFSIDVTGDDANASVVSVGRVVDAATRTVDVIYALRRPDPRLRVGALVRVSLPTGDDFSGIVIPRSALLEDEGQHNVYVQLDGERFAEQRVRLGPSAGERVGVVEGLSAGQRIVSRGAHLVRLAARARTSTPHGHVH
jgi:membrane fusion protein, heavy metal efflux system